MVSLPKAFVSWSSGKDAAYALYEARRGALVEVIGLLTTVSEKDARVAMHGVHQSVLDAQIESVGLPCIKVPLPYPCPNAIYDARMTEATAQIKARGATHMVFGDLFLEDIRAYRDTRLAAAGLQGVYPLWRRDTGALARAMIADGFRARLACIDPRRLDASFAGRAFDTALLGALPAGVDPCGENGEFHTAVTGGPIFARPIPTRLGAVETRDGFVYADIVLDAA